MARICIVTTTPLVVNFFLRPHLAALSQRHNLTLILNTSGESFSKLSGIDLRVIPVMIKRKIALFSDLRCLIRLFIIFYREQYDAVITVAPKAGLLGIVAAYLAGIRARYHIFQGEVWITQTRFLRPILKFADFLVAGLANHPLVISRSELQFLETEGILRPGKAQLFHEGSIGGVDIARFKRAPSVGRRVRNEIRCNSGDIIALFLGRLTRDKGVLDLAKAFASVAEADKRRKLLFVGPDEELIRPRLELILADLTDQVRFIDLTDRPEDYLAAADFLCLPSHREGFGNVIIEAAACGIPSLASRIYGITDAIDENETGLMHKVKNIEELSANLIRLYDNKGLRERLGNAAHKRTLERFQQKDVVRAFIERIEAPLIT